MENVYVGHINNLHAKYYSNEEMGITTSMNLYEYSQVNNYELGVVFYENRDRVLYDDALGYAYSLISKSDVDYSTISVKNKDRSVLRRRPSLVINKLSVPIDNTNIKSESESSNSIGFCIRCGKKISVVDDTLFCKSCHDRWAQYKNMNYEEKYCYFCGKPTSTSAYKPSCRDCFMDNRDVIDVKRAEMLKIAEK